MALTVRMAELHSILAQAITIVMGGHACVHAILLENIVKHVSWFPSGKQRGNNIK